jgi:hypothetical protein
LAPRRARLLQRRSPKPRLRSGALTAFAPTDALGRCDALNSRGRDRRRCHSLSSQ